MGWVWRRRDGQHEYRIGEEARGSKASDGTSSNEGRRVGCCAARGRSNEEDQHGDQVDPTGCVSGRQPSKDKLRHAERHEVDAAIPALVVERFELIGDVGNGGSNDCAVKRDEEDAQADTGKSQPELET